MLLLLKKVLPGTRLNCVPSPSLAFGKQGRLLALCLPSIDTWRSSVFDCCLHSPEIRLSRHMAMAVQGFEGSGDPEGKFNGGFRGR
jgi:hypothetical protein